MGLQRAHSAHGFLISSRMNRRSETRKDPPRDQTRNRAREKKVGADGQTEDSDPSGARMSLAVSGC